MAVKQQNPYKTWADNAAPWFASLLVSLRVGGPILPGEAVPFSWTNTTVGNKTLDLGTVTARVYVIDDQGNQPVDALFSFVAPDSISPGDYSSKQYSFVPPANQARNVYHIGQQILRLELSGSGPDGGPYSDDQVLTVIGEHIDPSWWEWTSSYPTLEWRNSQYAPSGKLHNKSLSSGHVQMTWTAMIHEEEFAVTLGLPIDPNVGNNPIDYPPTPTNGTLAQGGEVALTSPLLSKSWRWFTEHLWVADQNAFEKQFSYAVKFLMTDEFLNAYPEVSSTKFWVSVSVSETKRAALGLALHLLVSAAAILISAGIVAQNVPWPAGGIIAGALVTAAGIVVAAAEASGQVAGDPPEADPLYRQTVNVIGPKAPTTLREQSQFVALADFVEACGRIVASVAALSRIEGKRLGAAEAKDREWMARQQKHHEEVRQAMIKDASTVEQLAGHATSALLTGALASQEAMSRQIGVWLSQGIPAVLEKNWCEGGFPSETLPVILKLIGIPSVERRIADVTLILTHAGTRARLLATAAGTGNTPSPTA
jgi:hypothetical protein